MGTGSVRCRVRQTNENLKLLSAEAQMRSKLKPKFKYRVLVSVVTDTCIYSLSGGQTFKVSGGQYFLLMAARE